jgi:Prealbumin-like fold domain
MTTSAHAKPKRYRLGRRQKWVGGLAITGLVTASLAMLPAFASHPEASLAGSNFEIDVDANLKVDDSAPSIDWASVTETRRTDAATGTNDDSYAGGAKEDDACPGTTTGSIPNNKSDLLSFGAYVEPEAGGPGFLNLFWSRVNEPSGTTLMDFELNQSSTLCANGVNPVRTAGDLLIEYRIEQGGAVASIKVRTWTGSAWGPAVDLTAAALAAGTINSSVIPVAESDGLATVNPISPRTFGEAQLDLDFVFDEGSCESFGSAFLKSRASDSFTSQLKDFIRPVPVNITNCGTVIINKVTDPVSDPTTTQFGYTKAFGTDPATANTFTLGHGQSKTFTNVLFGSGYTVTEDSLPPNWEFANLDCSASTGVTPSLNGATVTFAIDNAADILNCTYTNELNVGAIKITKDRKHAASDPSTQPHPGVIFGVTGGGLPAGTTVTTDANGVACLDGLAFASYTVTENVPAGYVSDDAEQTVTVDNTASCGDDPYGGESLAFHNTPLTNVTVSVDSQIDGGTASTIVCDGATASTGPNGDGSLTVSDLLPTDPTVTLTCEITVDP